MSPTAIALNRFGLGARPSDGAIGDPKAWLKTQFDHYQPLPPAIEALGDPQQHMADAFEALRELRMAAAGQKNAGDDKAEKKDARKTVQQAARSYYQDAVNARAHAAIESDTPFIERLVHFWSNHFAVSMDKAAVAPFAPVFEATAIRPHVLGRFEDMLLAVERHPAMLLYLDQAQSAGPNSPLAEMAERRPQGTKPKRQPGLNENLAREIMELHTLGVRSGYTQEDVTEFARALTGWSIDNGQGAGGGPARFGGGRLARRFGRVTNDDPLPVQDGFVFRPQIHEPGTRTILGQSYKQKEEAQGRAILHDLAISPATARHIATKLATHFAGDTPPQSLIDRLAANFQSTTGDLPSLYRVLIDSPETWAPEPLKFKNPWEWVISSLRGCPNERPDPTQFAKMQFAPLLQQLGQPVWRPGSPAGWDDVAGTWAAPNGLLRRVELAQRFAAPVREDPRELAQKLLPGSLSSATQAAIAGSESRTTGIALLLVSPEFQRR